jgi:large repetitive protein
MTLLELSDYALTVQIAALGRRALIFVKQVSSEETWLALYRSDMARTTALRFATIGNRDVPMALEPMGDALYFVLPGTTNHELWKTDGDRDGTIKLMNLAPTTTELRAVGDTLFFVNGTGLWKTNGAMDGAARVYSGLSSAPRQLSALGGKLYFVGDTTATGEELWVSDGTAPGTRLLKDIRPGSLDSSPSELRAGATMLFFAADDGATGRELWASDGSTGGTQRITDIAPGTPDGYRGPSVVAADRLFFLGPAAHSRLPGRSGLFLSDGTSVGTRYVLDVTTAPVLQAMGSNIFFIGATASGYGLHRSDGTAPGTTDFCIDY